jgi:hypothetical protein
MRSWLLHHFASRLHPRPPRVELKDLPLAVDKIRAIKGPLTKAVESVYYVGFGDGVSAGAAAGLEVGVLVALLVAIVAGLALIATWAFVRFLAWLMLPEGRKASAAARFAVTLLIFGLICGAFAWGSGLHRLVVWVVKSAG